MGNDSKLGMPFAIRCGGWFVTMFACGYDILTPDEQNATAILIGLGGLLIFILAELRAISAALATQEKPS